MEALSLLIVRIAAHKVRGVMKLSAAFTVVTDLFRAKFFQVLARGDMLVSQRYYITQRFLHFFCNALYIHFRVSVSQTLSGVTLSEQCMLLYDSSAAL